MQQSSSRVVLTVIAMFEDTYCKFFAPLMAERFSSERRWCQAAERSASATSFESRSKTRVECSKIEVTLFETGLTHPLFLSPLEPTTWRCWECDSEELGHRPRTRWSTQPRWSRIWKWGNSVFFGFRERILSPGGTCFWCSCACCRCGPYPASALGYQ